MTTCTCLSKNLMHSDSKRSTANRPRRVSPERVSETNADRILRYYRLGLRIAKRVRKDVSIGEAIRAEGHETSRFTAYKAHQFAKLVSTDELERYLEAAEAGEVSWTHIQALLQVDKRRDRLSFLRRLKLGHWNPGRLRLEITEQLSLTEPSQQKQGRKFRVPITPEDLHAVLVQLFRRPHSFLSLILEEDSELTVALDSVQRRKVSRLKTAIEKVCQVSNPPH